MQLVRDGVTGEPLSRRPLNPGESFRFNINPADWDRNGILDNQIGRVVVADEIGRSYESDSDEMQKAIDTVRA